MKVSELLIQLQDYDPDTQLIVAYWDKECFESLNTEERLLTDKEWNVVAQSFEVQDSDQMLGADIRTELENVMKHEDIVAKELMDKILAEQQATYEEQFLWDTPATKITGEQNDNA